MMWEIFDEYCWTKQKKILINSVHRVPGLGNFAYWNFNTATVPSPLHIHSNIFEFHCMVKGRRYSQIEKDGKLSHYTVTGGQLMIVFPFEIHSNGSDAQKPCEFYAFQINVSDPRHLLGLDPEYSQALYRILIQLKEDNRHLLALNQTHLGYLRSAFNFFSDKTQEHTHIGVQFLNAFLFTLQYLQSAGASSESMVDNRLITAMNYIRDNMDRSIRLEELAEASGYSLSRFKQKFREEVGITPAEYVMLQKMEAAKRLLASTDSSITEIAYRLGFSTSNYFSSVFQKFNYCTPRDYRRFYLLKKESSDIGSVSQKTNSGTTLRSTAKPVRREAFPPRRTGP